jgi:inner membrane protein
VLLNSKIGRAPWAKWIALLAILMGVGALIEVVQSLNEQRAQTRQEAVQEVVTSSAGPQTLSPLWIERRCTQSWDVVTRTAKGAKLVTRESQDLVSRHAAASASLIGDVALQERTRGPFAVKVYTWRGQVKSVFAPLPEPNTRAEWINPKTVCEAAAVMTVSDARGLQSTKLVASSAGQSQALALAQGTWAPNALAGFHAPLDAKQLAAGLSLDLSLELAGAQGLSFVAAAKQTDVQIKSNWPHPAFLGKFLPRERAVQADGFAAKWSVGELASQSAAQLENMQNPCEQQPRPDCIESAFLVNFIDPVDHHALNERAVKYGMLFVVLTFIAVGLLEVLRGLRVHPIQYGLVGAALASFFLLLVALSEHVDFARAYAASSTACVLLLAMYAGSILHSWKRGLGFGAGIGLLYGGLFALLHMEHGTLLVGAVLVFLVLATVMITTRRVDWYGWTALSGQRGQPEGMDAQK